MVGDDAVDTAIEKARHLSPIVRGIRIDAKPGLMSLFDQVLRDEPNIRIDRLQSLPRRYVGSLAVLLDT